MSNPLAVLPDKARLWLYLLVTLGVMAFTAWQAAEGNWFLAVGGFLVSLQSLMSASNTGESTSPFRLESK